MAIAPEDRPITFKLPRPLWQMKEELAQHLRERPANKDILALTNWVRRKESLEMWITLGEQQKGIDTQ